MKTFGYFSIQKAGQQNEHVDSSSTRVEEMKNGVGPTKFNHSFLFHWETKRWKSSVSLSFLCLSLYQKKCRKATGKDVL